MKLVLFQPDIAQNVGAAMRLCACLSLPLEIVGPTGFPLSDKSLKRVAMDYGDRVAVTLHSRWDDFQQSIAEPARLILLTTKGAKRYDTVRYDKKDILLLGRESAGVPDFVHERADLAVRIPLAAGARSLNVAMAAAIVAAEALRQSGFPGLPDIES